MEEIDLTKLSEATKAEMELGRKTAAINAAALERAERERAGEVVLKEDPEATKAVAEAQPLKTEERRRGKS